MWIIRRSSNKKGWLFLPLLRQNCQTLSRSNSSHEKGKAKKLPIITCLEFKCFQISMCLSWVQEIWCTCAIWWKILMLIWLSNHLLLTWAVNDFNFIPFSPSPIVGLVSKYRTAEYGIREFIKEHFHELPYSMRKIIFF